MKRITDIDTHSDQDQITVEVENTHRMQIEVLHFSGWLCVRNGWMIDVDELIIVIPEKTTRNCYCYDWERFQKVYKNQLNGWIREYSQIQISKQTELELIDEAIFHRRNGW